MEKTQMSNTNEIVTSEEIVVNAKFQVTPAQKRQLNIRISDLANNMSPDDDAAKVKLANYFLMSQGLIPFEKGAEFKAIPLAEKRGEKTFTAFFFIDVQDMREAKLCLQRSLQLLHFPHCMKVAGSPSNVRRMSVPSLTKAAANKVFELNQNIFTHIIFSDIDRDDSGVKVEEVVQTIINTPAPTNAVDDENPFENSEKEEGE